MIDLASARDMAKVLHCNEEENVEEDARCWVIGVDKPLRQRFIPMTK